MSRKQEGRGNVNSKKVLGNRRYIKMEIEATSVSRWISYRISKSIAYNYTIV